MSEKLRSSNMPKKLRKTLAFVSMSGAILSSANARGNTSDTTKEESANVSTNIWGGYVALAPEDGQFTSVEGTFKVPKVKCPPTRNYPRSESGSGNAALWVGMDGYGNHVVEQIGITSECLDNSANTGKGNGTTPSKKPRFASRYHAWWMNYGGGDYSSVLKFPVHAGDVVDTSVAYKGGNNFLMELNNRTRHRKFRKMTTCILENTVNEPCPRISAEWIVERSGNGALANFGSAQFSNAEAVSTSSPDKKSIFELSGFAIDMVQDKTLLESNSQLGSDGESFSMDWIKAGHVGP
jgi:hypothetical protein